MRQSNAASDRSRLALAGLRSGLFGGHKSEATNFSFTLKELDRLTRTMRWYTVLLEYVSVTSSGTNEWQHLLHQYDAVITAINLSARIDENEARASGQR